MERYRQGYLERLTAYLASQTNVDNPFVVGPARFPTERMRKRIQWADNKANDLLKWDKMAQAAIRRRLLEARPQKDKDAEKWHQVQKDIRWNLDIILENDEGHHRNNRAAFVTSIVGKVQRLAMNGEVDLVRKSCELVREFNAQHQKPAITDRHKFWSFEVLAQQRAEKAQKAASKASQTLIEGDGATILIRHDIDRVQILFHEKPSVSYITELKIQGWKWSPRSKTWQRKLTHAAQQSALRIVGDGDAS